MDYRSILLDETHAFGSLIGGCDASAPVPTCPGWTVDELFRHVGRGNRWAAELVSQRADSALDPRSVPDSEPPAGPAGGPGWLRAGATLLIDAVASAGPDTAVWTFLGPRPARWWLRRRAYDTMLHAVDAAIAAGTTHPLAAEVAADALTEFLERVVAQSGPGSAPLMPGRRLTFVAADVDAEWAVRGADAGLEWSAGDGPADVVLRGAADDLLLVAVRRRLLDDTRIRVVGDPAVWREWLGNTPFESSQNRSIAAIDATGQAPP
ncbi:maleylpyruvate isomerase family mycothiol-dependent enzyme [Mycobacterium sp. NPDC003449]